MKTQLFDAVDVYKQDTSTVSVLKQNKLPNGIKSSRNSQKDGSAQPLWRKK